MTRAVEEVYEQASQLPEEDRAELAGKLLESIGDPADEGVRGSLGRRNRTKNGRLSGGSS